MTENKKIREAVDSLNSRILDLKGSIHSFEGTSGVHLLQQELICCETLLTLAQEFLDKKLSGEHLPHEHAADWKEHDSMTTDKLAEHLGVPLWVVMEAARWEQAKSKLSEEVGDIDKGTKK